MPHNNGPGGPYIVVPPPPPPPVALYVPDSVTDTITDEQRAAIAVIELEFAGRVSDLLREAYAKILDVVRTDRV